MALEDIVGQRSKNVSRRSIVKTSAKLAYAAPLVAATATLNPRRVGAQIVSPGGTRITVLGVQEAPTDTGVDVAAGQTVCVSATGLVHLCLGDLGRNECPTGPEGDPGLGGACGGPVCGLLFGSIGGGARFEIGASECFVAAASGRLFLVVHDLPGGYSDNDGSYQAIVTI